MQLYLEILRNKDSCIVVTLGTVNDLLQFMTNLDYVKGMLADANSQAQMIETVAASSEEMSAATEDISNFVQESNTNMTQAIHDTNKSLLKVDSTFEEIETNINEIHMVKNIMSEAAQ